ncbi:hypothetical protein GOBAR_DD14341 [Gossypium barbadense]|nr:hypothetical protein GOBAR_DD14341 [Gossypium barbadense]
MSLTTISPFPISPLPQIRIPNPCPILNNSLVPELKTRIKKYFEGYEEALPSVLEGILRRKLAGKHEETDDELMDELEVQPRDDVDDEEFESNFTNLYSTGDEEDMLRWDKLLPGYFQVLFLAVHNSEFSSRTLVLPWILYKFLFLIVGMLDYEMVPISTKECIMN